MAKTTTIGTKVDSETHEKLAKLAATQNKSVSELVRDLIEESLTRDAQERPAALPEAVTEQLDRIEQQLAFHHNALGELLVKAVRAGAASRYFARLTASYGQDITSFLTTQKPLDAQTKGQQMAQYEAKCAEFENDYLMKVL